MEPVRTVRGTRMMIIGSGMMGSALARVAADNLALERLVLVDVDQEASDRVAADLAGRGPRPEVDIDWRPHLDGVDIVVVAASWEVTAAVLRVTVESPLAVVSITRPPVGSAQPIPADARRRRGPAILPVGLEPGLAEIVLDHVAGSFDLVRTARVLCGGLTTEPPAGFPYRLLFNGSALPFALRPAYRIVNGELEETTRFAGLAPASLPGLPATAELESYHDGMVPWLVDNPRLRGATVEQRTVRWTGFAHAVRVLHDAGLLDDDPVEVAGTVLRPREVTQEVLGRRIRRRPDEREVTYLDVTATGTVDGREVRRTLTVSCGDSDTTLSSGLAALTAVPAIEAVSHARSCPSGWIRPDEMFRDDRLARLRDTLKRYGATWRETRTELQATR